MAAGKREAASVRRVILTTVLSLIPLATVFGGPVELRIQVIGVTTQQDLPLAEVAVACDSGASAQRVLRVENGRLTTDLPDGVVCHMTPRALRYWGETRAVIPSPGASTVVDLRLWPAAIVRGELAPKSNVTDLAIEFQPSDEATSEATEMTLPRASSECEIAGTQVTCVIPAGRIDYSLRSTGRVPIYKWDQRHVPGEVVNLGIIRMRKGLSLFGKVVSGSGTLPKDSRIIVRLEPAATPAKRPGDEKRSTLRTTIVVANARGHFLFEGLQPGGYTLSASTDDAITEREDIVIVEGAQAELRDPLVLSPPATLTVVVTPPADPWRRPWAIEVSRLERDAERTILVGHGEANADGRWLRKGLTFGEYLVKVKREPNGVWHTRLIELHGDELLEIPVPVQRVIGRVSLGGEPLEASLWFGGTYGEVSVPVRTESNGTFKALLPARADNRWPDVDVVAERPSVRRNLKDVRLSPLNSDGVFTVTLELPSNRIYGEVTTQDGRAADRATVIASMVGQASEPLQLVVDEAGVYSFTGLAPGTYELHATGPDGKSDPVTVEVDDETEQYRKLVLAQGQLLEGTVSSANGAVADAQVLIYPDDRTRFQLLEWARSEPDGSFRIAAPRGTPRATVAVVAPGYPYSLFDVGTDPRRRVQILLSQAGGEIRFEAAEPSQLASAYLFKGGAFMPLRALNNAAIATFDGKTAIIGSIASAPYDICVVADHEAPLLARTARASDRCVSGFLPPGGNLSLTHK